MQYLNKAYDIDLNKNLSDVDKAVAVAFQVMAEEFLVYVNTLVNYAWADRAYIKKLSGAPGPVTFIIKSRSKKRVAAQGIGGHAKEEVIELVDRQISAISVQLGSKPYLMGNDPTEVDCTIYGILAQFKWHMDKDFFPRKLIEEKYTNINEYLERIKTNYYPDWNDLVTEPEPEQ